MVPVTVDRWGSSPGFKPRSTRSRTQRLIRCSSSGDAPESTRPTVGYFILDEIGNITGVGSLDDVNALGTSEAFGGWTIEDIEDLPPAR